MQEYDNNLLVFCSWQAGQGGGHRTLLYGHAILLRHSFSSMVSIISAETMYSKEKGVDQIQLA